MNLDYSELIGVLAGLSLILMLVIAALVSTSNTDQSHDSPDLNDSVEDLKFGFNYSEKKEKCSSYNGTIVNYSYGVNDSQTFVGCKI